jgi:hypothetical protein
MLKKLFSAALLAASLGGCAYGGVSAVGGKHVVVAVNDGFLFGILKKVYVCQVTPKGLTNCSTDQSP